jgi:BirA family biotin operon repressor/biotin-[acetyl-CoA-carboxylase] ligase
LLAIRNHWLERAYPSGTPLRANLPDGEVLSGTFETLDNDGALNLRLANGTIAVIHAGDIFLL